MYLVIIKNYNKQKRIIFVIVDKLYIFIVNEDIQRRKLIKFELDTY